MKISANCRICKNEFMARSEKHYTCSTECRRIMGADRKKSWTLNNQKEEIEENLLSYKRCSRCNKEKTIDLFIRNSSRKNGKRSNICKDCRNKEKRELLKTSKGERSNFNSSLKTRYGIDASQYDVMYNEQEGKCFICGIHQSELKRRLCVDHNHTTGEIRKLLCGNCNLVVGNSKENPTILENTLKYLNSYKGGIL